MYEVHYWPTPNGKKVTILLEELGAQYRIVPCNIGRGDQFTPEFLKMNPNRRMPVLVDHSPTDGGDPLPVFESVVTGEASTGVNAELEVKFADMAVPVLGEARTSALMAHCWNVQTLPDAAVLAQFGT